MNFFQIGINKIFDDILSNHLLLQSDTL